MLVRHRMLLKQSTNGPVTIQPVMSEPTKFIVRCCELRKRRVGQFAPVPNSQPSSGKSGN